MLLAEPQSTPADFHFHIGQIPVRVTGWFWPAAGLFGWGLAQSLAGDDTRTLLVYLAAWVLVVFCSILVHELGHALAFAASGQSSAHCFVSLWGLGGTNRNTRCGAQESFAAVGRFSSRSSCSTVSCDCCHSYSDDAWISGTGPRAFWGYYHLLEILWKKFRWRASLFLQCSVGL